MFDPEKIITLYFAGDEAFTQADVDQLSEWIGQSQENAVEFIRASFTHRAIHDFLGGEDLKKNAVLDLNEATNSDYEVVMESNVSLKGIDVADFMADEKQSVGDECQMTDDMLELFEMERTAPAIEIPKVEPQRELIQQVVYPRKKKREIKKFSLYSAIVSSAALVLLLVFARFAPPPETSVATITDSVNAQWANSDLPTDIGSVLCNNDGSRWLQKGTVKIEFDYGAEVIIEGPAEFELMDEEKMMLHSGRLYAAVPERATGFTVQTPYSTVIDLGTHFGVMVDYEGSTDVHMFQGKASLIPGAYGKKKESLELVGGQAKGVTRTGQVREIKLMKQAFVRNIDSQSGYAWRGQDLNLADIVGGGNGFGTGLLETGIDSGTGKFQKAVSSKQHLQNIPEYKPVDDSPFIDGVFVPDGGSGEVVISSLGHTFKDCPDTSGGFWFGIQNGAIHPVLPDIRKHSLTLSGVQPKSIKDSAAVFIHANQGITYDLEKIRQSIPGVNLTRFTSSCGLSDSLFESANYIGRQPHLKRTQVTLPKGEFWVLVDGEVRFSKTEQSPIDNAVEISIPISKSDRFLTIAVVSTEPDPGLVWSLFANPRLHLERSIE